MRVIAGEGRGRRLKSLPGLATRPTADRVKESLFNILGGRCTGAVFLDLYAGTGNIGIEALSRGAQKAVFVDNGAEAVRIILANLNLIGYEPRAEVRRGDVVTLVGKSGVTGERYNLIFLDPPYQVGLVLPTLQAVERAGILTDGGWLIAEHSRREPVDPPALGGLELWRQEKYGDTRLTFLRISRALEEE